MRERGCCCCCFSADTVYSQLCVPKFLPPPFSRRQLKDPLPVAQRSSFIWVLRSPISLCRPDVSAASCKTEHLRDERAIHYRITPRCVNKGSLSQLPSLHTHGNSQELRGWKVDANNSFWNRAETTFRLFWSEMFMSNQQNGFAAFNTQSCNRVVSRSPFTQMFTWMLPEWNLAAPKDGFPSDLSVCVCVDGGGVYVWAFSDHKDLSVWTWRGPDHKSSWGYLTLLKARKRVYLSPGELMTASVTSSPASLLFHAFISLLPDSLEGLILLR